MDIKDIINSIYELPKDSMQKFIELVEEIEYPKGFLITRENRPCRKSYFIAHGLVRAYSFKNSKEVTFWFGTDGDMVLPFNSLHCDNKEYSTAELLEDSVLYEIETSKLRELYLTDINIANWGRRFAETACNEAEKLFIDRQFKTSLELYEDLISNNSDIIQRVPLGIIASYLGTTQANLSRIRANIK